VSDEDPERLPQPEVVGPDAAPEPERPPQTDRKAIWSLVTGVIGVLLGGLYGLILGIVAIVLGRQAMRRIDETGGQGRNLAKAGLIIGVLGIVLAIAFAVLFLTIDWVDKAGIES
jgi:hypothetical protein